MSIETTTTHLVVTTADGRVHIRWADCSPRLAQASQLERNTCQFAPSGYGIHWPLIDEDLAVGPLLAAAATEVK